MAVRITIRNVPDEVRDELAARATLRRQSMQEFLRGELERIASRPAIDELLRDIRAGKAGTRIEPEFILQARDARRRE